MSIDVTTIALPVGDAATLCVELVDKLAERLKKLVGDASATTRAPARSTDACVPVPESVTKAFDPVTAHAPNGNSTATPKTQMIVVSCRLVNGPKPRRGGPWTCPSMT